MLAFATLGSQITDLLPPGKAHLRETTQDGARALETFLAGVERKAFRIAQIALRHEAAAQRAPARHELDALARRGRRGGPRPGRPSGRSRPTAPGAARISPDDAGPRTSSVGASSKGPASIPAAQY